MARAVARLDLGAGIHETAIQEVLIKAGAATALSHHLTSQRGKIGLPPGACASPFTGEKRESAGTRPLAGANPGAVLQEITHAATGATTHSHLRRRPAYIQVSSPTLSGEEQASVPPLSP
jgi:hypothetical protein